MGKPYSDSFYSFNLSYYLVYFCIFSWISTIGVIFWALRSEKFIPDKPQNRTHRKQNKQKVKFEKSKNSLNFTNVKVKNK